MLIDDIDGTVAAESVTLSYRGAEYSIDLSEDNARRLDEALEPFLQYASKSSGRKSKISATERAKNDKIRQWAKASGHSVPARGRIPESTRRAYEERSQDYIPTSD